VVPLWAHLEPVWGPARDVREHQPYLVLDSEPAIAADPGVRPVRLDELDLLYPASVAMFTEEVGVSPEQADGGVAYRASVAELVRAGRAFARIEGGRVIFKAEVGVVSPRVCQIQGVWVAPRWRGRGLAAPGMAAVARLARARCAPVVTLYVNDYNERARRAYSDVGFREHATFMSVLL
jgi:predicted GNAT family acetyltransferase